MSAVLRTSVGISVGRIGLPMRIIVTVVGIFAAAGGVTACAYDDRGRAADVNVSVWAPEGYHVGRPDVLSTATGTRISGSICSDGHGEIFPPNVILIEREANSGRSALVQARLRGGPLRALRASCLFYDANTPWALSFPDRLRVCAVNSVHGGHDCP